MTAANQLTPLVEVHRETANQDRPDCCKNENCGCLKQYTRKSCCYSFVRGLMSEIYTVIILFNLYDIAYDLVTAFISRTDEPIKDLLKIFAFIALPVSLWQTWLYHQHKFGLIWHPRNSWFNETEKDAEAPERRNDENDETFETLEWRYDVAIYWATAISLFVEVFPQSMLVYLAYEHRCPSSKLGWFVETFEITCTIQAFLSLVAICMYCLNYGKSVRECATFCKSRGCLCRESCCECCSDCCKWNVKCSSCNKEFRECQCLVKKHRVGCCCSCCRCEIECPSSCYCASCTGGCLVAVTWLFRVFFLLLAIVSLGVSIASLSIFLSKCS